MMLLLFGTRMPAASRMIEDGQIGVFICQDGFFFLDE